jgi:hypothetical protein
MNYKNFKVNEVFRCDIFEFNLNLSSGAIISKNFHSNSYSEDPGEGQGLYDFVERDKESNKTHKTNIL